MIAHLASEARVARRLAGISNPSRDVAAFLEPASLAAKWVTLSTEKGGQKSDQHKVLHGEPRGR